MQHDGCRSLWANAPHVVLLGAGASRAAFPKGERHGKILPLQSDLTSTIGLEPLLVEADVDPGSSDFEGSYTRWVRTGQNELVARVEAAVQDYFAAMELPDAATLYDRLFLSLTPKDIIATFNWDPLLLMAALRNQNVVPGPQVYFLHGSVAAYECADHNCVGLADWLCAKCQKPLERLPLLFPMPDKDYASHPCIARAWTRLAQSLRKAARLTIFGYSAPAADSKARQLLAAPWAQNPLSDSHYLEVIDTRPNHDVVQVWNELIPLTHLTHVRSYAESSFSLFPRRTTEAAFEACVLGEFPTGNALPPSDDLQELQRHAKSLVQPRSDHDDRHGS